MSQFDYDVNQEEDELVESSGWCGDGVNGDGLNESGSDTWKEEHSAEHEPLRQNDPTLSMRVDQVVLDVIPFRFSQSLDSQQHTSSIQTNCCS